jgi:hypothetical protein
MPLEFITVTFLVFETMLEANIKQLLHGLRGV